MVLSSLFFNEICCRWTYETSPSLYRTLEKLISNRASVISKLFRAAPRETSEGYEIWRFNNGTKLVYDSHFLSPWKVYRFYFLSGDHSRGKHSVRNPLFNLCDRLSLSFYFYWDNIGIYAGLEQISMYHCCLVK